MSEPAAGAVALSAIATLALAGWIASLVRRDVSIVDSFWALFFLVAALAFGRALATPGPRALLVPLLVAIWAARLSGYITWRNHGQPEDRRYQAIRARNQPGFEFKSLYLVFGLQGLLALVIAVPLLAAIASSRPPGPLDVLGCVLFTAGLVFETIADAQLARFRRDRGTSAAVLDTGLWRYTRHPNYFGEALVWWGFYLIAVSAGAWWSIFAPLLMTMMLLKVSGVVLLEKDIVERRPAYRDYIARTNAFVPWFPKAPS